MYQYLIQTPRRRKPCLTGPRRRYVRVNGGSGSESKDVESRGPEQMALLCTVQLQNYIRPCVVYQICSTVT